MGTHHSMRARARYRTSRVSECTEAVRLFMVSGRVPCGFVRHMCAIPRQREFGVIDSVQRAFCEVLDSRTRNHKRILCAYASKPYV